MTCAKGGVALRKRARGRPRGGGEAGAAARGSRGAQGSRGEGQEAGRAQGGTAAWRERGRGLDERSEKLGGERERQAVGEGGPFRLYCKGFSARRLW